MLSENKLLEDDHNPLDSVEEVLVSHNWSFNRMTDEELIVEVEGKSCSYKVFFIWQEDMAALQFCAQYDVELPSETIKAAGDILRNINENLWMGHFDLPNATCRPSFRHTCLLSGMSATCGPDHIEDLVEISLAQCERYFPVFDLLARQNDHGLNSDHIELAMMDASGEC